MSQLRKKPAMRTVGRQLAIWSVFLPAVSGHVIHAETIASNPLLPVLCRMQCLRWEQNRREFVLYSQSTSMAPPARQKLVSCDKWLVNECWRVTRSYLKQQEGNKTIYKREKKATKHCVKFQSRTCLQSKHRKIEANQSSSCICWILRRQCVIWTWRGMGGMWLWKNLRKVHLKSWQIILAIKNLVQFLSCYHSHTFPVIDVSNLPDCHLFEQRNYAFVDATTGLGHQSYPWILQYKRKLLLKLGIQV